MCSHYNLHSLQGICNCKVVVELYMSGQLVPRHQVMAKLIQQNVSFGVLILV